MRRTVFLAILLSFFMISGLVAPHNIPAAKAQDMAEAYLVKDVEVDVIDQSAVAARDKAFTQAQEKAYGILAERFKTIERNSVGKVPSEKVLSGLVQDFEIVSEQTSLKRYRGTYNFRFRPAAVRGFFGHGPTNYIPPKQVSIPHVLLIPYFINGPQITLWDKRLNPLFAGITLKMPKGSPIVLPNGDTLDKADVKETDPRLLTPSTIKKLIARYDVADVVLAVAQVRIDKPHTLNVVLYRTDRGLVEDVVDYNFEETVPPQQGDANVFLQASLKVISDLGGDWKKTGTTDSVTTKVVVEDTSAVPPPASDLDPAVESALQRALAANPGMDPVAARNAIVKAMQQATSNNVDPMAARAAMMNSLQKAVANPGSTTTVTNGGVTTTTTTRTVTPDMDPAIAAAINQSGNPTYQTGPTLARPNSLGLNVPAPVQVVGTQTTFTVFFSGMPQWLDMQKQLMRVPSVISVEMMSMKTDQAQLRVMYQDWNTVQSALMQRGFQVEKSGDGYILKRSSGVF